MTDLRKALGVLLAVVATCTVAAHGNNDHVRGVVTRITDAAIVLQTPDKQERTLTVSGTTTFERSGKPAGLKDLKVGDRVVVDVPKGTLAAELVKFGAPAKTAAPPSAHKH
jgi:hypothetical protein